MGRAQRQPKLSGCGDTFGPTERRPSDEPTWSNVLRGCAYGDAWGDRNEFRSYAMLAADSPCGPELPEQLRITDDTQMTLSLVRALNGAARKSDAELRKDIIDEFVRWLHDPDNNRAPGNTCLAATRNLAKGLPWTAATVPHSDGCGTVMRASPSAFLPEGSVTARRSGRRDTRCALPQPVAARVGRPA